MDKWGLVILDDLHALQLPEAWIVGPVIVEPAMLLIYSDWMNVSLGMEHSTACSYVLLLRSLASTSERKANHPFASAATPATNTSLSSPIWISKITYILPFLTCASSCRTLPTSQVLDHPPSSKSRASFEFPLIYQSTPAVPIHAF
jgi:hypothetical protein